MKTLASYDELPYDRLPFPETEPDFLAALARLHGFEAADARTSRILELGCAQGGNLIPMAARHPDSEFVGVDLSRVQVEEGQAFIAQAGLANIRLLHGDIAALPHPGPLPQAGEGAGVSLTRRSLKEGILPGWRNRQEQFLTVEYAECAEENQ